MKQLVCNLVANTKYRLYRLYEEGLKRKCLKNVVKCSDIGITTLNCSGVQYIEEATKIISDGGREGIDFYSIVDYGAYIEKTEILLNKIKGSVREWRDNEYLTSDWYSRCETLLGFVESKDSTLLDIGCGSGNVIECIRNMDLEQIKYYGLDYVSRNENTLVYDLNEYQFPDEEYDVFLCSGVIEYVVDADWFFEQFSKCRKQAVISYCLMERADSVLDRRRSCWKSDLTMRQIINMMSCQGFVLFNSKTINELTVCMDFRRKEILCM